MIKAGDEVEWMTAHVPAHGIVAVDADGELEVRLHTGGTFRLRDVIRSASFRKTGGNDTDRD